MRRLAAATAQMTTATLSAMDERHAWFRDLDAEHRSWITLVARAGIDQFVTWFADETDEPVSPAGLFGAAPREVMRRISLHQTVELVRTTVEVVEEEVGRFPRSDRSVLQVAIVHFSREVAFAAAELYAQAAEMRGAWDARLEALVVDAVVRSEADETLVSRASTLGWRSPGAVSVVVGLAPDRADDAVEDLRRIGSRGGLDVLAATQGDRLVVVLGGDALATAAGTVAKVAGLADCFGEGPVVVGPSVASLSAAGASARSAFAGLRAASAWPEAPRPVLADDLLPERALAGDGHARRQLAEEVFRPLRDAGGDLLATLVGFLDSGSSIEASARALFVHPNTVRYRLRRINDVTGYSPTAARDAYVLRLGLTVGRLLEPERS